MIILIGSIFRLLFCCSPFATSRCLVLDVIVEYQSCHLYRKVTQLPPHRPRLDRPVILSVCFKFNGKIECGFILQADFKLIASSIVIDQLTISRN